MIAKLPWESRTVLTVRPYPRRDRTSKYKKNAKKTIKFTTCSPAGMRTVNQELSIRRKYTFMFDSIHTFLFQ